MLSSQSPISSGNQILKGRSERKALQPKNSPATTTIVDLKIKSKNASSKYIQVDVFNKENVPPFYQYAIATTTTKIDALEMEPLDSSLAEELSAIRRKMERLRLDKENTEKVLKDREAALDKHMKKLQSRGEIQKHLETEVDRLYRLQELKLSCMRISPIRSLRDKEEQRKTIENLLTGNRGQCIDSQTGHALRESAST